MTLIRTAMPELVALAAEMRPDWSSRQLEGALGSCHHAGWPWTRTLTEVVRLLCDERATPHDLAAATRLPPERGYAGQQVNADGMAAVRAALNRQPARRCPDEGACHHGCGPASCFRVQYCGPLSGVYPGDEWPEKVRFLLGPDPVIHPDCRDDEHSGAGHGTEACECWCHSTTHQVGDCWCGGDHSKIGVILHNRRDGKQEGTPCPKPA